MSVLRPCLLPTTVRRRLGIRIHLSVVQDGVGGAPVSYDINPQEGDGGGRLDKPNSFCYLAVIRRGPRQLFHRVRKPPQMSPRRGQRRWQRHDRCVVFVRETIIRITPSTSSRPTIQVLWSARAAGAAICRDPSQLSVERRVHEQAHDSDIHRIRKGLHHLPDCCDALRHCRLTESF